MQRIVDGLNDQEKKITRSEDQSQNVMTAYAKCNVTHHIKKRKTIHRNRSGPASFRIHRIFIHLPQPRLDKLAVH
eukprot:scaffold17818_cov64-Cylindrotheca_fusiformis.AAC.1